MLTFLPSSVFAAVSGGNHSSASFRIQYQHGGKGLADAEFSLYEVADISGNGQYIPNENFEDYSVRWTFSSSSDREQLAETLSAYAARDDIRPFYTGKTDANGDLKAQISESKLYLAVGAPCESDGKRYTCEPILFSMSDNAEANLAIASPKPGRDGGDSSRIDRSVVKVWKDDDSNRPEQIQVQLLRNGVVYETVTLNEENNWRHNWKNLKANAVWQVTEKDVPEGYTVAVDLENTTFIIMNTSKDLPIEPVEPTGPTGSTDPDNPNNPDNPGNPDNPSQGNQGNTPDSGTTDHGNSGNSNNQNTLNISNGISGNAKLPQTGVYWWPIPLLACAGMSFFLFGWVRYKGN